MNKARFALLLCALLLSACGRPPDWTGDYRGTLQLPGGELPFGLEIRDGAQGLVATLVNGDERLQVDEIETSDGQIHLALPGLENTITARREGDLLRGEFFFVKARALHQRIPFAAQRGVAPRFFPAPGEPGGDVSGRWAVTFTPDAGDPYIAVGEFQQDGSQVKGTFLTGTGDYRFLHGELREGRLYLGTFNGGQAFLFHAALSADGALDGEFWSGLASHQRFSARRDDNASLGNTTQATALRMPNERFDFRFPDLDGQPVSLSDARFAGKVVVVTLAGSWCPNCHDEAAFLGPYSRQHRDAGLEVIALMFEQFDTQPEARAAVMRFRDRWQVPYPLLLAGISPTDDASTKLPQLNGVFAYPTTIFIDRKGVVRHIHTGFSGPATGEHHTALLRDFDQRIQALLAETL